MITKLFTFHQRKIINKFLIRTEKIDNQNKTTQEIVLSIVPELSLPFSGLPLEYMVANFPSKMKRNHPFDPFDSSSAAESDQTYKQSRPRHMLHSRQ